MAEWLPITQGAPLDGVVVDTKIDDEKGCRNEQPLKRGGNLWFFEDGSGYVYYRPTHWRPTDQKARAERLRKRLEQLNLDRVALEAELRTCGVPEAGLCEHGRLIEESDCKACADGVGVQEGERG